MSNECMSPSRSLRHGAARAALWIESKARDLSARRFVLTDLGDRRPCASEATANQRKLSKMRRENGFVE